MKKIELNELKTLQMDVLSAVHRFCLEHNIKYSLACGSMIGCIRHKGYIPWDDDIDIYLLREDYNRLIQEFPDTFEGRYKFVTFERDSKWNRAYGKIYDTRTILKETGISFPGIGVNIDVFPIDQVPQKEKDWISYNKYRLFWQRLYEMKVISFRKARPFYKNAFLALCKILLLPFTSRQIALYLEKIAIKNNNISSDYVFECVQGLKTKRFKKSVFNEITLMPFENRVFFAFVNYDEYLTSAYGNWKKLPPKEKRITHHAFKAWWK